VDVSYDHLPDDQLAAVVTFLEMRCRPEIEIPPSTLSLRAISVPTVEQYRDLFCLIGARWLWFSRLIMEDSELEAIIRDRNVEVFEAVDSDGRTVGMLELDFREAGACELAFVGLIPELSGRGHGRWLLAEAISRAWRHGVARVHVHTCSLDHPAALAAYRREGFTPYKRAVERFPDPRLLGALPCDCAPQIPLLGTCTSA